LPGGSRGLGDVYKRQDETNANDLRGRLNLQPENV
jgi:hypothetical protein